MRGYGRPLAAALLVATATATGACAGGDHDRAGISSTTGGSSAARSTVTVMAPATLKAALDQAAAAFERTHPGATVRINYGHVPALLTQIAEGVPADVLITPDEPTMAQARAKRAVGPTAVAVARNDLVLVAPASGKATVRTAASLGDAALTVAVCASELPCGKLTAQVAAKAGVTLAADSLEPGGSPAVVTKAAAGEIDLGVCFLTDARAAGGKVTTIPLDRALGGSATVTAAVVRSPANARGAEDFRSFLASAPGRALFTGAGFSAL